MKKKSLFFSLRIQKPDYFCRPVSGKLFERHKARGMKKKKVIFFIVRIKTRFTFAAPFTGKFLDRN
jgi:hypothetical protein